jgi:16S rRNA (guanine(966)-N(2))-methyltransferase RsmD
MRVIAGELKGRRLVAPRGWTVRPTSDRVREAIFDILGPVWNFPRILDLFAGTGALGIEAVSRGAGEAVFVEQGKAALTVLKGNLKALGLKSRAWILPVAAKRGIAILAEKGSIFNLIFIDPPYGKGLADKTLEEIVNSGILATGAIIVVEHSSREEIAPPHGLVRSQQRRYGDTTVSFYAATAPSSQEAQAVRSPSTVVESS